MSQTAIPPIDRTTAVVAGAVALVLVAGYVVLAALGVDPTGYALFISGPIVSTAVGAVLARRVAVVQATTEDVRHATDGLLTNRLDRVDDQMVAASAERQQLAATAAGSPAPGPAAGPVAGPSSGEELPPRHRSDQPVDL